MRFTQAEEDFLREGVVKYDGDATKWRKILDDPDYHFHESRNTVDLKDKWRNILKKDGAEEADWAERRRARRGGAGGREGDVRVIINTSRNTPAAACWPRVRHQMRWTIE